MLFLEGDLMASDFFKKLQDIVIKFLPKKAVKDSPITDDTEAADVLAELGRVQAEAFRQKAEMTDETLRIQERYGADIQELEEKARLLMTKLREYALGVSLDQGVGGSKTMQLPTGSISFYDGKVAVSIKGLGEVMAIIAADPHLASSFLEKPKPTPPKLDKAALAEDPMAVAKINEQLPQGKGSVKLVRPLFFAAHPTALAQIKEGVKVKGKVKDQPVD